MCGITGKIGCWNENSQDMFESTKLMNNLLKHRGPDDTGVYVDSHSKVSLGHTRLSIIDLDKTGHQPMHSNNKKYVIVFNGEIYNHIDLKKELCANNTELKLKGSSDTEVLLESINCFGLENTIKKCNGMFSFVLFDKNEQLMYFVRDRGGIKPIYICRLDNNKLAFASEIKAFRCLKEFCNDINPNSVQDVMSFGYIKNNKSIYKKCFSIPPGCILQLNVNTQHIDFNSIQKRILHYNYSQDKSLQGNGWQLTHYWYPSRNYLDNDPHNQLSDEATSFQFHELLKSAVKIRLMADVPVGLFLSSGIDSSLIAALSKEIIGENVNTYSIGFCNSKYDEGKQARENAKKLGVNNTLFEITESECLNYTLEVTDSLDEPFGDPSLLPTYLVSKLARQHVKVALTGDGADELFGGYNWYNTMSKLYPLFNRINRSNLIKSCNKPRKYQRQNKFQKLIYNAKLFKYLMSRKDFRSSLNDLHKNALSEMLVKDTSLEDNDIIKYPSMDKYEHPLNMFLHNDYNDLLPNCFLTKVDRASMLNSLECRSPFMDYRMHNFAYQISNNYKLHNGTGKVILKDLLVKYLPKTVVYGPKKGFSVPVSKWLLGPLKPLLTDLINDSNIIERLNLNRASLNSIYRQHYEYGIDNSNILWNILVSGRWVYNNTN
jgi:asparagine synthase (glutamine-hydrolysing)